MSKKRPLVVSFRHNRTNKNQKPFQQYCTNFSYKVESNSSQMKPTYSNHNINSKQAIITPTARKKKFTQIFHMKNDICDELFSAYSCRNSYDSDSLTSHVDTSKSHCSNCIDYSEQSSIDNKFVFPKEKFYGNAKLLSMNSNEEEFNRKYRSQLYSYNYNCNNIVNKPNNIQIDDRDFDNNFSSSFNNYNKRQIYFSNLLYNKHKNDGESNKCRPCVVSIDPKYSISLNENCPQFLDGAQQYPFSTSRKTKKHNSHSESSRLNKKSKSLPSLFGISP